MIYDGQSIMVLARWEVSTCASAVPPLDPVIDMEIIGDVRNMKCRYPNCKRVQKWELGKAAFLVLMSRYNTEQLYNKT